jgi:hypothetical protein
MCQHRQGTCWPVWSLSESSSLPCSNEPDAKGFPWVIHPLVLSSETWHPSNVMTGARKEMFILRPLAIVPALMSPWSPCVKDFKQDWARFMSLFAFHRHSWYFSALNGDREPIWPKTLGNVHQRLRLKVTHKCTSYFALHAQQGMPVNTSHSSETWLQWEVHLLSNCIHRMFCRCNVAQQLNA